MNRDLLTWLLRSMPSKEIEVRIADLALPTSYEWPTDDARGVIAIDVARGDFYETVQRVP